MPRCAPDPINYSLIMSGNNDVHGEKIRKVMKPKSRWTLFINAPPSQLSEDRQTFTGGEAAPSVFHAGRRAFDSKSQGRKAPGLSGPYHGQAVFSLDPALIPALPPVVVAPLVVAASLVVAAFPAVAPEVAAPPAVVGSLVVAAPLFSSSPH